MGAYRSTALDSCGRTTATLIMQIHVQSVHVCIFMRSPFICCHIISPPASRVSAHYVADPTGNLDDTNLHKICLSCHIALSLSEMQQRNEFLLLGGCTALSLLAIKTKGPIQFLESLVRHCASTKYLVPCTLYPVSFVLPVSCLDSRLAV